MAGAQQSGSGYSHFRHFAPLQAQCIEAERSKRRKLK
jgi:hypothetical protein